MPVFEYEGLYLGLASMYKDGDTSLPDYDTVDLDLTWSINTTEWNKASTAEDTFIPHGPGMGKYPDGAFDSSVIFSSIPVVEEDKLWFYYMGGKGLHTGWRETALGRGHVLKDRFASYSPRQGNQPMEVTTQGLNFHADNLKILADVEPGGWIKAELRNTGGTVVQTGFEADNSNLTELGGGWKKVSWQGKSPLDLPRTGFYALKITSQKAKIWAVGGDIHVRPLKYQKP